MEDQEFSKEIISKRLKDDHLKQIGKYEFLIADKFQGVDEKEIKILKCREQTNTITCLCISSNNQWIFSGSKNGVVVKCKLRKKKFKISTKNIILGSLKESKKLGFIPFVKTNVDRILGHTGSILSIAISSDEQFLVSY